MALRAEIFNNEIMEALMEPDEDDPVDDDVALAHRFQRKNSKAKQLSGSKKRGQFESSNIAHSHKTEEERKVMRNFIDEDTLEDEFKRAMAETQGKKGGLKSETNSPDVLASKLRIGRKDGNNSSQSISQINIVGGNNWGLQVAQNSLPFSQIIENLDQISR